MGSDERVTTEHKIVDDDYFIGVDEGRRRLGISGDEFIRRWDAGEYDEMWDTPGHLHIGDLASLIPFARPER